MPNTLQATFYLIMEASGTWGKVNVRITTKEPKTNAGERCVKISLDVPSSLFTTPQLTAKITIPEGQAKEINVELTTKIEDVIFQALGIRMAVSAVETES